VEAVRRTGLQPRPAPFRDARLFVIAVEGAETEPWYFGGLIAQDLLPIRRVTIEVLAPTPEDGRSAPEHAAARLDDFLAVSPRPPDERWLVVDVDRHHNLMDTLARAERAGVRFALSNPCFEVWLQLHLTDTPKAGSSAEAKVGWGRLRDLEGPGWPFRREHVVTARDRAQARDQGSWIPEAPGSAVHRLITLLLG
jgi:hypothetical protein